MSGGFPDLGLLPELVRATQSMGWLLPSDVQDESIPLVLGGGDVMVAARTGSGKTGAFGLPAVQLAFEIRQAQLAASASKHEAAAVAGAAASSSGKGKGSAKAAAAAGPAPVAAKKGLPAVKLASENRSAWIAVHPSGMLVQSTNPKAWGGVRANVGILEGRGYFEFKMNNDGIGRVGVGTIAASDVLGTCASGFGYGQTGMKSNNKRFEAYGEPFERGDVIGVYVCVTGKSGKKDAGWISFSRNGKLFDQAYRLPKGAKPLFPMVCLKNGEASINFGARPFKYPPTDTSFKGLMQPGAATAVSTPKLSLTEAETGALIATGPKAQADKAPLVLILEPTRDLAEQTYEVLREFSEDIPGRSVKCVLLCGGVDTSKASSAISKGVEVVVGTPGRVLDFARVSGSSSSKGSKTGGNLDLSRIRLLILDEADKLVGDAEDRDRLASIWSLLPKEGSSSASSADGKAEPAGALQVCFFSATLHSPQITELAERVCHNPTWVDLKGKDSVPDTVHHAVVEVNPFVNLMWAGTAKLAVAAIKYTDAVHSKDRSRGFGALPAPGGDGSVALTDLEASQALKVLKLVMLPDVLDSLGKDQCMIFCRTNMDCESVCGFLSALGGGKIFAGHTVSGVENPYSAVVVGGSMRPHDRKRNLEAFKAGDVRCLVCTDAVARGIDVAGLPFMINFCLPDDPEQYIHRSGRVGRADRMGLAVSLVAAPGAKERVWFLQKSSGKLARTNLPASTKDFDQGGNCVWMDEAALLRAVEARLQRGGAQTLVPAPESATTTATAAAAAVSSSSSASSPAPTSAAASATSSSTESGARQMIPRIIPVPLVSTSGSARALPEVTAELESMPGRTALLATGDAGASAPALTSGTGRLMMHAMRFPDGVGGDGTVYGESKMEESGSAEGAARLLALQPTVTTLALLEKDAQTSYLQLRARFGVGAAMARAAGAASSM